MIYIVPEWTNESGHITTQSPYRAQPTMGDFPQSTSIWCFHIVGWATRASSQLDMLQLYPGFSSGQRAKPGVIPEKNVRVCVAQFTYMCTTSVTYNSLQLWDNHLAINHHSSFGHFVREMTRAVQRVGARPLNKCFFAVEEHQLESDIWIVTLHLKTSELNHSKPTSSTHHYTVQCYLLNQLKCTVLQSHYRASLFTCAVQ